MKYHLRRGGNSAPGGTIGEWGTIAEWVTKREFTVSKLEEEAAGNA